VKSEEILDALLTADTDVAAFFLSLSPEELALRIGTAWTAMEQLDHLNTAVGAVTRGFAAPKLLLRLRFGRSKAPGLSYTELRDAYRARLAAGGRASGAFVPKAIDPMAPSVEKRRDELVERWRRRNARLRQAVSSWSDQQLDSIALPHPLLGKISAREMLFFAIYHAEHHVVATKKRLPRCSTETFA
jgi:hypothetical protein